MNKNSIPQCKRLILFDIDGTLLRTGGAGALAFNRVFAELYGISEAWQGILPDGKTDPILIEELFLLHYQRKPTLSEENQICQAYEIHMAQALQEVNNFRLMPGVLPLLESLSKGDFGLLGLATGNYESTARMKVEKAGLAHHFSYGGFGSHSRVRLELTRRAVEEGKKKLGSKVRPEDVLVVGDTLHDIACAKGIGAISIAVATGTTPFETLKNARPDFIFESFENIEDSLSAFY